MIIDWSLPGLFYACIACQVTMDLALIMYRTNHFCSVSWNAMIDWLRIWCWNSFLMIARNWDSCSFCSSTTRDNTSSLIVFHPLIPFCIQRYRHGVFWGPAVFCCIQKSIMYAYSIWLCCVDLKCTLLHCIQRTWWAAPFQQNQVTNLVA